MRTVAAVLTECGRPLELAELDLPELTAGQVLVDLTYSGLCHTQLLEARGHRGPDKWLPHCLGHEGSGVVREVGPGVRKVKPGDAVILSWLKGSGLDSAGIQYRWGGRTVNAGGVTTFQRAAVVAENRLTRLPAPIDMADAALLGCAGATGLGVVHNVLAPVHKDSLAVFGTGGIGLFAVAAARLHHCEPVIAVDVRADREALARRLGATHFVRADQEDPVLAISHLVPGGVRHAVEATGRPAVMAQALASVMPRRGAAAVVGNAHAGELLTIDPRELNQGKRLLGTWGGNTDPDRDFPRYAAYLTSGRLDLSPLRGDLYPLERINEALDDLETGRAARPLIAMG